MSASETTAELALLPHQMELVEDISAPLLCLVAGLGSGKSFAAYLKAIMLAQENPGLPGMCVLPTYPMARDIAVPTLEMLLELLGIRYEFLKAEMNFLVEVEGGTSEIRIRNGEHPHRLHGPNLAWAILDEAGQMKEGVYTAVRARVRDPRARVRQTAMVGTPEGMAGFFYTQAEAERQAGTRVIGARTSDNHFLPADYEETNLGHLSADEAKRLRFGLFVPPSGQVYPEFSRDKHLIRCPNPTIGKPVMLCDFNVGEMHWACGRLLGHGTGRDPEIHVWGELIGTNTTTERQAVEAVKYWQARDVAPESVLVVTDASGSHRRTSQGVTGTDTNILRSHGFEVRHPAANPAVQDRVNTVNGWLKKGWLLFDPDGAPRTWKAIEAQGRDKTGAPDKAAGLDHGPDAVGYGCWFIRPIAAPRANATHYV